MRILLAVHAFPPRSTAGVEVYTLRLARALVGLGHAVRVFTAVHDLGATPYELRRRRHEGVDVTEVVSLHQKGSLEATYDDPEIDAAAAVVFEEFQPQCVHVQHLLNLSAGIVQKARSRGSRVVMTLHDYWLSCPRDGLRMRADLALCETMDHAVCATCLADSPYLVPPLQRGLAAAARGAGLGRQLHRLHVLAPRLTERALALLRRITPPPRNRLRVGMDERAGRLRAALEAVDLVLAPTSFARDRAVAFGVPIAKTRVVPLGVVPGPTRPRAPGARRRLGFIGTLAPHKGVHVLVQAFRSLVDPAVTLDVHGSTTVHPSYVSALRRAAEGDRRIRFHGPFTEGEQERVLSGLDLLVCPSVWWENSPVTALEAMAAGVPVVASRTGGVPEIVRAGSGLLVPPGDAAALTAVLEDVVSGRSLAEAHPALALKTTTEGARELVEIYTSLAAAARA